MYSARAGGYHRWLGGIRPPIASVGCLGDIPVARNLRSLWGGGDTDSAVLLRPVAGGGLGLDPSAVTILSTFLVTYTEQLNHPHEMVRSSVRHGLRSAQWRFNQAMGFASQGLHHSCRAHGTDHDRFLIYTYTLGIRVLIPEEDLKVPESKHHLAVVSSPQAVKGVHA